MGCYRGFREHQSVHGVRVRGSVRVSVTVTVSVRGR